MKKILVFLFALFSLFSLTSCEDMNLEDFDFSELDQWLDDYLNDGDDHSGDKNDKDDKDNNNNKGKYTIYFDLMGLGNIDNVSLKNINKIPDVLPEPTPIEGYEFNGWYKDEKFTEEVILGEKLNNDVTLYAKFSLKTYKIKCVYNGECLHEFEVKHGAIVTIGLEIETEEGYVHKGWGVNGKIFNNAPVTSDLVLEPIIVYADVISIEEFMRRADPTTHYFIKGIVTASENYMEQCRDSSFILSDGTGHLFVYQKAMVYMGDEVLLSALYKNYYSMPEVSSFDYFKILSRNNDCTPYCKDPEEYNITDLEKDPEDGLTQQQLVDKYYNKFLRVTGLLVKDGSAWRLKSSIYGTYSVRIFGPENKISALENRYVYVEGFMREARNDRSIYLQINYIDVEAEYDSESISQTCENIKNSVKIDKCIYDKSFELPVETYMINNMASLEYRIVGESFSASIDGNVLTIKNSLLTEPEEVKIEILISFNGEVYIEEFTCVVEPIVYTSIADFLEMKGIATKYLIKGIVINTDKNNGHMIADETGTVFTYLRMNVEVGDEVVVNALYQDYYGAPEIGVGSEFLDVVSTGNDINKYIPEIIEENIDLWVDELVQDDFNATNFGAKYSGKLIHFKGYLDKNYKITASDNIHNIVRYYTGGLKVDIEIGKLVDVYAYFRGVRKDQGNVIVQLDSIETIQSDATKIDLEKFYEVPTEYLGKKVEFEGIITEKVEEGLFIATYVKNKKEHQIYVEGDYNIGDRYSFIGHIELFKENKYRFTRKNLNLDSFTADILRKLATNEYIILDSDVEYESYYGNSLYEDGLVANCSYENNVLSLYIETNPHGQPDVTVVFILSVEVNVENVDTQQFIGKKVSGKLYKETIENINTHFILDLSLIVIR